MIEEKHDIPMPGGMTAHAYAYRPDGKGPWPAVLYYTDAMGVRPAPRDMAGRLAAQGYYVLLPNLYYREGPIEGLHPEKDMPRIMKLLAGLTLTKAMPDTAAYLSFLKTQPAAKTARVGCTGYCMGGRLALAAAAYHPDHIAAAGCFHGARMATDDADSPHRMARHIRGHLYIGVAEIDPFLAPGETDRLKGALEATEVAHRLEIYPGVQHGFAVPDLAPYDNAAADRHWERLSGLLKGTLG